MFSGSTKFPALKDSIEAAIGDKDSIEKKWNEVKKQISILIYSLNAAKSAISEPENFRK